MSIPKRSSKPSRRLDVVQNARRVVDEAIRRAEEPEAAPVSDATVSQVMAAMGRKGGLIGGKRRLETMTPEKRSALARIAVQTRWAKKKLEKKQP
jgi:hypothetical protein